MSSLAAWQNYGDVSDGNKGVAIVPLRVGSWRSTARLGDVLAYSVPPCQSTTRLQNPGFYSYGLGARREIGPDATSDISFLCGHFAFFVAVYLRRRIQNLRGQIQRCLVGKRVCSHSGEMENPTSGLQGCTGVFRKTSFGTERPTGMRHLLALESAFCTRTSLPRKAKQVSMLSWYITLEYLRCSCA